MKRLSVTCPIVAAIVLACGQTRTHANFFGHIVWIERGAIGQPGTLHTARLDGSDETIISNTVINGSDS